jgi:hypothetical protein
MATRSPHTQASVGAGGGERGLDSGHDDCTIMIFPEHQPRSASGS